MRTALVAGALLAFGLSFDEIIVTIYLSGTTSTLPLWISTTSRGPRTSPRCPLSRPLVLLISIIPVYIAIGWRA